jgi:hypothetical protein
MSKWSVGVTSATHGLVAVASAVPPEESTRVEVHSISGKTVFVTPRQWGLHARLEFGWDTEGRLWVDSGDVGASVYERNGAGRFVELPWNVVLAGSFEPPAEIDALVERIERYRDAFDEEQAAAEAEAELAMAASI